MLQPSNGPSQASLCGYRVSYLDHEMLRQLFREIFVDRLYDVTLENSAPRIVDCGSNIGVSILFFKQLYPNARIIGFEPHPVVFRTLEENIARNALKEVVVHQKALAEKPGSIDFYQSTDRPGALNMSVYQATGQTAITVQADRLANYIDGPVDLLKLDIEGAEEEVIRDLAQSDRLRFVNHIVCEYHHHRDRSIDRLSEMLGLMERAGFGYHIDAYRERFSSRPRYQQDVIIHAYRKV